jgi:hypothetical protein
VVPPCGLLAAEWRARATAKDARSFIPRAAQFSIQSRHCPETLDDTARCKDRHSRATLSSAPKEGRQNAESACVEVSHAREVERNVRYRLVQLRSPERFVCTVAKDQAAPCAHDDPLCLTDRHQRKLTRFGHSTFHRLPIC